MRQQTPMKQQQMKHQPVGMLPQQTMAFRRIPYPIINHNQKGVLPKMFDYLMGDGANSWFGMICKECLMHNGGSILVPVRLLRGIQPVQKATTNGPSITFEQNQLGKMLRNSEPLSAAEDSNSVEADAGWNNRSSVV